MSNTHIPVRLKTNIHKLETKRLASDRFLRYKSTITGNPIAIGHGKAYLTANEKSFVHEALLNEFVADDKTATRLSKRDILTNIPVGDEKLGTMRCLAVLTVYQGQDSLPTELTNLDYNAAFSPPQTDADGALLEFSELAPFKRFNLPNEHSKLPYRWMRVHAATCGERQIVQDLKHPISSNNNIKFYLLPVELTRCTLSLGGALTLDYVADANANFRGAPLTQFEYFTDESQDDIYTDLPETEDPPKFPGILAITQPNFRVRPGPNDDFLLSTKLQTTICLESDFATLADFITAHCRSFLGSLQSDDGVTMLRTKLRGVHVEVSRFGGRSIHMVMGFQKGTPADVPMSHRHYAWPSEGSMFHSPHLPVANLGTLENPKFLPMEACSIVEDQKLRGPRDLSLSRYVSSVGQSDLSGPMSIENVDVGATLITHYIPQKRPVDLSNKLIETCHGKLPNLLFVEAGSTAAHSQQWRELRHALATFMRQTIEKSVSGSVVPDSTNSLLSLRYKSGSHPSTSWTAQLQKFVAANQKPGETTIVVVWLESEHDSHEMYKAIKRSCDIKAGAQTFFVKRATHERKILMRPAEFDGDMHTAKDICRRICQKNPPMLRNTSADESKLVIAMHVEKVPNLMQYKPKDAEPGRDSELYVVTFVSRDLTRSEGYHTERGLFGKAEIKAYEHMSLLKAFFGLLSGQIPRSVIILRSGHIDPTMRHTGPPSCESESSGSPSSAKNEDSQVDVDMTDRPPTPPTLPAHLAGEIQAIRECSKALSSSKLTFVTLTEDSTLETRILGNAIPGGRQQGNKPSAMVFFHDAGLMDTKERSVKIQQTRDVRREHQGQTVVHKVTRPGAITAAFYGATQMDEEISHTTQLMSSKSQTIRGAKSIANLPQQSLGSHFRSTPQRRTRPMTQFDPMTPSPNRLNASNMDLLSSDLTADVADARSEKSPASSLALMSPMHDAPQDVDATTGKVTTSEIDLLAAVWQDDALGLHGTKWPVPTHLARLAAKRAMVHLYTKGWQDLSQDDAGLVLLPEVHKNVRDTLYYL